MILSDTSILKDRPVAISIGTFDGVHLGHKELLDVLNRDAKKKDLASVVISFNNIPRGFITGEKIPMVLATKDKLELIDALGVDYTLGIDFNEQIQGLSKREFFEYLDLDVRHVVMGYDHKFGHERRPFQLQDISWDVVGPVVIDDQVISSTLLRRYLTEGNMEAMYQATGHHHFYSGVVVHGHKRGKKLGFPTMNLSLCDNLYTIKRGVYVTQTLVQGQWLHSVTNVGFNPSFEDKSFTVETHILDYEGMLYSEEIKVRFLHYIREERYFGQLQDLIQQIEEDVVYARDYVLKSPMKGYSHD